MKKIIKIILTILLVSCTQNANTSSLKKEQTFLGSIQDSNGNMVLLLNTEVYLTTVNNDLKNNLIKDTTNLMTKYHILLDSHHYYNDSNNNTITNLKVLNDSINKGPIKVDSIIIDALKEAINISKLTKGYFNFTIGNLSSLYSNKFLPYDSISADPDTNNIEKALQGIISVDKLEEYIILNETNNTIELKTKDIPYTLDLGAFSKGYIIDKVYNELIKYNTSFLLNAGASSIVAYTNPNENIKWNIGIQNPEDTNSTLLTFSLNNGALTTSGDYQNYYYLEDGTKRHHILNPFTGYSENYYNSNTLISNNAGIIDALSTALFNINDNKEFMEIITSVENYYNDDISFLYIEDGLNIYMDNKFNETIIKNIPSAYTYTSTIIDD